MPDVRRPLELPPEQDPKTIANRDTDLKNSCSRQIRLHVYDLMLLMPIAGVEVLDTVGLEQNGAVDEPGLFRAGVVP